MRQGGILSIAVVMLLLGASTAQAATGKVSARGTVIDGLSREVVFSAANDCTAPLSSRPSIVEWAGVQFTKTTVTSSDCFDDPNVAGTPPAGFDTQVGSATGTLSTGGGATYDWIYVDATTGGSFADTVELTIRDGGGNVILSVGAQRPNQFSTNGGVWTFGSGLPI